MDFQNKELNEELYDKKYKYCRTAEWISKLKSENVRYLLWCTLVIRCQYLLNIIQIKC